MGARSTHRGRYLGKFKVRKTMTSAEHRREYNKRWRATHRESEKLHRKQRYAKHKETELSTNARWRARNPHYMRRLRGLPEPTRPTPAKCECCLKQKATHLDHDHITGKFRGWLCGSCNRGLGQLGDNVYGIMRAMSYLTRLYDEATGKEVNL